MKLIEILLLIIPAVAFALWNGRNGISHPNIRQVRIVFWTMFISCGVVRVISISTGQEQMGISVLAVMTWYFKAFAVSITGYALVFPPLINYIIGKNEQKRIGYKPKGFYWSDFVFIMSRLSSTAIPDKWLWWRKCGWLGRLLIYITLFELSIKWFW